MIQKTEDMKREATLKNSFLGRRAVVVGAGLGGLSVSGGNFLDHSSSSFRQRSRQLGQEPADP